VNADLAKKWGREMSKRNRYFSRFGISTVTFTDSHLTSLDLCFADIEQHLSARPEKPISLDTQLAAIEAFGL
jgi:hypothetical protein